MWAFEEGRQPDRIVLDFVMQNIIIKYNAHTH